MQANWNDILTKQLDVIMIADTNLEWIRLGNHDPTLVPIPPKNLIHTPPVRLSQ